MLLMKAKLARHYPQRETIEALRSTLFNFSSLSLLLLL
jgi:hypothetical protein